MHMIDITMTATLRQEIFHETLVGICEHVIGKNNADRYRLILNVDQIGEKIPPKTIIKIAKRHFPSVVVHNVSKTPSFCKAVKWVWSQATADYIFHIEDDWKFFKKIDVDDMIRILNKH